MNLVELLHWQSVLLYSKCEDMTPLCLFAVVMHSFYVTHRESLLVLSPLSLLSHLSGFIPLLLHSSVHPLFFLSQLQHEKAELEQHLEQEQEFQVNKLMKKIKKMENETISKQLTLEQVCKRISASSVEQHNPECVWPVEMPGIHHHQPLPLNII